MRKQTAVTLLAISILLLAVVSFVLVRQIDTGTSGLFPSQSGRMPEMGMNPNMGMGGEVTTELVTSTEKEKELALPPLLEGTLSPDGSISYTIVAQEGSTQLKEGNPTQTYGYNGTLLGPVIRIRSGQKVNIQTENSMDVSTSFHWHGLKVPSNVDGGPHNPIEPGEAANLQFTVNQGASTLWFHPHAEGIAGEQVYEGLAGLIYIEDENSDTLPLPKEYGINDFPVVIQDRFFERDNQLDYARAYNPDGTYGDTLVVNGTINSYIEVKNEKVRLRLLNGSNARNYQFRLSDNSTFYQIASDGGFLNEPIPMENLQLVPGERAEIIVDLSSYSTGEKIKLMEENVPVLALTITEETTEEPSSLPTTLNIISKGDDTGNPDKVITFSGMGHMVAIDGKRFDMERVDLRAKVGTTEVWEIDNAPDMMGGMIHPFHLHGVQFKVLSRNGNPPPANEQGWKDTIALYPGDSVRIEVTFPEKGIFMYHCHILEHEDNGMMGQVLVE